MVVDYTLQIPQPAHLYLQKYIWLFDCHGRDGPILYARIGTDCMVFPGCREKLGSGVRSSHIHRTLWLCSSCLRSNYCRVSPTAQIRRQYVGLCASALVIRREIEMRNIQHLKNIKNYYNCNNNNQMAQHDVVSDKFH